MVIVNSNTLCASTLSRHLFLVCHAAVHLLHLVRVPSWDLVHVASYVVSPSRICEVWIEIGFIHLATSRVTNSLAYFNFILLLVAKNLAFRFALCVCLDIPFISLGIKFDMSSFTAGGAFRKWVLAVHHFFFDDNNLFPSWGRGIRLANFQFDKRRGIWRTRASIK